MTFTKKWFVDMAERVVGTFVAAFLGALLIPLLSTGHLNIAAAEAAGLAGIAAAVTFLKSVIATKVGSPNSASMVPSVGAAPASPAVMVNRPVVVPVDPQHGDI